jgi:hypothetical protein
MLDGCAPAVHLDLREVPAQEIRDSLFEVVALLTVGTHGWP